MTRRERRLLMGKGFFISVLIHCAVLAGLFSVEFRAAEKTPTVVLVLDSSEGAPQAGCGLTQPVKKEPDHNVSRRWPKQPLVKRYPALPVPARPVAPVVKKTPKKPKKPKHRKRPVPAARPPVKENPAPTDTQPAAVSDEIFQKNLADPEPDLATEAKAGAAATDGQDQKTSTYSGKGGLGRGQGTGAGDTDSPEMGNIAGHFSYLRELILKRLKYPREAKKKGWEGKLIVSFVIFEDGLITDSRILSSSGHPVLDQNVLEAIRGLGRLPKPPMRVQIKLPILYKLDR